MPLKLALLLSQFGLVHHPPGKTTPLPNNIKQEGTMCLLRVWTQLYFSVVKFELMLCISPPPGFMTALSLPKDSDRNFAFVQT